MQDEVKNTYSIHDSRTGELICRLDLLPHRVEILSSGSAEGHFQANSINELSGLGTLSVYAIIQ